MKYLSAFLLLAISLPPAATATETPGNPAPNIIFVLTDDLGYGDLGSYGQEAIVTPEIDRMADQGMRFTQFYSGAAVCAPARSVLMTGLHTGHTTIRANFNVDGERVSLKDEDVTVAEILQDAGYVTGMAGKWGLGEPETEGLPNDQGFDDWFGFLNQRNAHNYFPSQLWRNRERVTLDPDNNYSHDLCIDFALDFIRDNAENKFFLYLPLQVPHSQFVVPETLYYGDKPWNDNTIAKAEMIARLDRDMGRMIDLLQDLGIDGDTIIFLTSDNGPDKQFIHPNPLNSAGDLRGGKRDLTEGGIRVPMIVRWPGKIPAGTVSDAMWYFPDVLPTFSDLAGTPATVDHDGVSVYELLLGAADPLPERYLYWEDHEGKEMLQAIRQGNWKGLRTGLDGALKLYDLSQDPGEEDNVAGAHPEMVNHLESLLDNARTFTPHWPVGASGSTVIF